MSCEPGACILIADESERGARSYEHTIPGFMKSFKGQRAAVTPPVELVPSEMQKSASSMPGKAGFTAWSSVNRELRRCKVLMGNLVFGYLAKVLAPGLLDWLVIKVFLKPVARRARAARQ